MYTWYAATRTGWKSPKWLMMSVTMLQLVQMIGGIAVTVLASSVIQGALRMYCMCNSFSYACPLSNLPAVDFMLLMQCCLYSAHSVAGMLNMYAAALCHRVF